MRIGPAITRDFSKKRPPVFFTIDDERYDCFKALDFEQLRRFVELSRSIGSLSVDAEESDDSQIDAASSAIDRVCDVMKIVMKKKSYAVFVTKVRPTDDEREADDFEPVDPIQLMDIIKWLMETYTSRPTQPSSSSSTGSDNGDGGTSSTAGASLEAGAATA